MMSDAAAREILVAQWPKQPLASYQIVQAIGRFEGLYGSAFKKADGTGNNNWGASSLTTAEEHGGVCPVGTTPTLDHRKDGTPYTACIQDFDTPELGARSLVRALTIRRPRVAVALKSGDALEVARAMATDPIYMVAPPEQYATAILRNARTIAKALREPLHVTNGGGAGGVAVVLAAIVAAWLFARHIWH